MSEEKKNFLENIKNILSDLEDAENGAIISLNQEEIDSLKSIPKLIDNQQKEIKEYKSIVGLKRPVMEIVHEMNKFDDEFISKDKIREKIERLDNNINNLFGSANYDEELMGKLQYSLDILQELLKE